MLLPRFSGLHVEDVIHSLLLLLLLLLNIISYFKLFLLH